MGLKETNVIWMDKLKAHSSVYTPKDRMFHNTSHPVLLIEEELMSKKAKKKKEQNAYVCFLDDSLHLQLAD